MREQSKQFLRKFLENHTFEKVLDVGSLDVTGHIRDIFPQGTYTGVDMRAGVNVDVVVNGHDLAEHFGVETFDFVVCFDTFEHDDRFWETLDNMKRVLKPGGYLMLGVPSRNCPEHDHPHDYWRFMPQCMASMLEGYEDRCIETEFGKDGGSEDEIYGYARKP